MQSSNDAGKTLDGPSRSETGVVRKKNNVNRNASFANIRGQSKSNSILNKVCHERSPIRAISSHSVRPRTQSSHRNLSRPSSTGNAKERVVSRTSSKTREWDKNVSRPAPRSKENNRSLVRLPPKSRESDRNFSSPPRNKESNRNLSRLPPKGRESDRNLSRLPPKGRESDRNLARLLRSKGSDYSVARSASKIRESNRSLPRLPLKKDGDRNIPRPVAKGKVSDRNIPQPTAQCNDVSKPATKCDKTRDIIRPLMKSKDSERSIFLPGAPASSASVSGLVRGQPSGTRVTDRSKQKPAVSQKSGGTPKCNSHKILSRLSLKKLSSFAFKKKTSSKKTANVPNEPASILKGKERPRSNGSGPSSTRLDEATQYSRLWTGSAETSTKPSRDSLGTKQQPPSNQRSQTDLRASSRPAERLDQGGATPVSKSPKERPSDQNALRVSKKFAGRCLQPSYQQDDILSVESFVDCPEKSSTRQECECYCHPEDSTTKPILPMEESVCSGESLTKPKENYVSSPASLVGRPTDPKENYICSPELSVKEPSKRYEDYIHSSEGMPNVPPAVCSPEVSVGRASLAQENQTYVCSPVISTSEPSCSPLQVESLCEDVPTNYVFQPSFSQECVDNRPNELTGLKRIISQRDANSPKIDEPKANDSVLKRSHSQLDATRQPVSSKLPPKREASTLKRTTSECICVPAISSELVKSTKEDPCANIQNSEQTPPKVPSGRLKTPSKTVVICTKPSFERDVASTRFTSECLMDKSSIDDDSSRFTTASEPSVKPRLEKDDHHTKAIQSLTDLEVARDASGMKSKEVNICPPKTPKHPRDESPEVPSPQISVVQQTAAAEDRRRGEQTISCENLDRLRQVCSALRQDTLGTSGGSVGVAQYPLYAVRESTELQSDATEVPLNACSSGISRESLPALDGHGQGVSKPSQIDLTCHPEECSQSAEGDSQSRTESICDSGGSLFSKSETRTENFEKCLTPQENEVLPAENLLPSKDGVPASLERVPLAQCIPGNESSDSTEPPPDESNLSSEVSHEKESSDGEVLQPNPTTPIERSPLPKTKSPTLPDEEGKLKPKSAIECPDGKETVFKPVLSTTKSSEGNEQKKPSTPKLPKEATLSSKAQTAGTVECNPSSAQRLQSEQEPPKKSGKTSPPRESPDARKDVSKPKGPGKVPNNDKVPESTGADHPVCLPQRRSTAESNDSIIQRLADQAEVIPAEEGSAARCEPITKLKLKKQYKEPTQSDLRDIQEDIRIWKDLYAGCLERLRSLQQMNQTHFRTNAPERAPDHGAATDKPLRRTSNNGQCNMNEITGEMDEAVRVLESEYGQVESALRKHSAVLAELVSVLQNRMTAQPDAPTAGEVDPDAVRDVKDGIHYLKALITENETLTMQLAAERAKQQVLRQVQVTNDVVDESISATEDKLHRTNSLLKMQMKRLQYEISRLTEAQNIEMKAGTILVEQAQADVANDLEALHSLQESNERLHELLSSKRFVSGQRVFKRASRGSFLSEELLPNTYCSLRRDQLESKLVISDRVQRNVELSNDEIHYLHSLGQRMCNQISETNEEIRKSEFAWLQLRKERDELTKDLYPDVERLQKMQDVAKEKLDLESKLRKENMLFRHQLEEFQKDLLEVETELMSGAITRRTEATKNKVLELETLYENAKLHNSKLREECDSKNLTISRHDSLASLSIDEEEFQRQISEKIQRMELRIQADMDRRLLRPKRYVLEAPGKAKVSFRGQRNVIRAPKNVAEWRRKREAPQGAAEPPPKPQQPKDAQELRREILAKLAEEKERAKEQLLRYEAHQARHAADTTAEPSAQELNELLGRLGRFLNQTRGQEPSPARPATTTATQSLHGGEFGETLMHLIVQLDQLQSALTGEDSRRRTVRPPTLAAERHRELLETLPDASKRGSKTSNPTRQNSGNNNGNNNNS